LGEEGRGFFFCLVGGCGFFLSPLEEHDLTHGLEFWGKSLLNLQEGVFIGSTTYLEKFLSTYKCILLGKSMACSFFIASDIHVSLK